MEVLSEVFGDNQRAEVRSHTKGENILFEVLWNGASVGMYPTHQEASVVAHNFTQTKTHSQLEQDL
tara:strand:- start:1589 stop:1786 length:198 start_codon:yes stop_codon:yes gene_type:complete